MKKQIRILAALMFVTFSIFFTSCEKDVITEEDVPFEMDGSLKSAPSTRLAVGGEIDFSNGIPEYLIPWSLAEVDNGKLLLNNNTQYPYRPYFSLYFDSPDYDIVSEWIIEWDRSFESGDYHSSAMDDMWLYNDTKSSSINLGYHSDFYSEPTPSLSYGTVTLDILGTINFKNEYGAGWDIDDSYRLWVDITTHDDEADHWIDGISSNAVEVSPASTINGVSFLTVPPASLPSYTATFTAGTSNCYAYQWSVVGEGVIVGSSTGNSVTIDFDTYGGKQIYLKVKEESGQEWSSLTYKSHTIYPQYY